MVAEPYTGSENLEVMAEARRYNAYLLSLVMAQAQGMDGLIDFGAGAGTFIRPLRALGYSVTAVEPDDRLRAHIETHGIPAVPELEDLPDASVRFAYTLNVLEHIADDVGALRVMRRKLKPGGRLMIYVPAFDVLFSSMDRKVGHVRRYTVPQLRRCLGAAGLQVEQARYVDFLGFFAALSFRLFDTGDGRINRKALIAFDRAVFPVSLALDRCFSALLGKNVYAVARRMS